jgi:hypothetical protein
VCRGEQDTKVLGFRELVFLINKQKAKMAVIAMKKTTQDLIIGTVITEGCI